MAHGPGTKRPVRKKAGNQEEQCVARQKIVCQRVRASERNHHPNQPDDGQTNAHYRGGDCENVDADILLQMRVCIAVPVRFSFHGGQLLDQPRKRLFRQ